MNPSAEEESDLRAKYLDWCSAQVADRFLELSPEEIYALAAEADRNTTGAEPPPGLAPEIAPAIPPSANSSSSYRETIQKVTNVLVARMGLPTYEQWLEAYRADPRRIERDLWEGHA